MSLRAFAGATLLGMIGPISPPTFGKNAPPQDGNAFVRLHRDIWVNTDLKSDHALGAYLDAVDKLFVIALMTEK